MSQSNNYTGKYFAIGIYLINLFVHFIHLRKCHDNKETLIKYCFYIFLEIFLQGMVAYFILCQCISRKLHQKHNNCLDLTILIYNIL